MTDSDWQGALSSLALHLAEQRRAVEQGDAHAVEAFVPPAGLGPLPAALAQRARELHAECQSLEQLLLGACRRTATALTSGRSTSATPPPAYLDSHG